MERVEEAHVMRFELFELISGEWAFVDKSLYVVLNGICVVYSSIVLKSMPICRWKSFGSELLRIGGLLDLYFFVSASSTVRVGLMISKKS